MSFLRRKQMVLIKAWSRRRASGSPEVRGRIKAPLKTAMSSRPPESLR
jgi:hypothetical protein